MGGGGGEGRNERGWVEKVGTRGEWGWQNERLGVDME